MQGLHEIMSGHLDSAITLLKDDKSVESQIACGCSFSLQNEHYNALKHFNNAISSIPGGYEPLLYSSQELIALGNFTSAEHQLTELTTTYNTWDVIATNGQLRYEQKRYAEALQFYLTAFEKLGNDETDQHKLIYGNLGHCYRQLGQFDNAINAFENSLGWNDFIGLSGIGWCYYMTKKYQEALEMFNRALSFKDDMVCQTMLDLIAKSIKSDESLSEME
ncbi:Uncharacterized protein QTN25_010763 [Entamoeba marina]